MWCIPTITPEFIERMEDVLDLYAKPYDPHQPVLCFDEKSKQLLADTQPIKPTAVGMIRHRDYEYRRGGTANIFLTVEPKGGYRSVRATRRRTRADFAEELQRIVELPRYRETKRIHVVLDNLNTHNPRSLQERFGLRETQRIMRKVQFHHTPKHASWLNMAEIEIGVMSRQALKGRIPTQERLKEQLAAWQQRRNGQHATIDWTFTKQDAKQKLKYVGRKLS
jgi:transposase